MVDGTELRYRRVETSKSKEFVTLLGDQTGEEGHHLSSCQHHKQVRNCTIDEHGEQEIVKDCHSWRLPMDPKN